MLICGFMMKCSVLFCFSLRRRRMRMMVKTRSQQFMFLLKLLPCIMVTLVTMSLWCLVYFKSTVWFKNVFKKMMIKCQDAENQRKQQGGKLWAVHFWKNLEVYIVWWWQCTACWKVYSLLQKYKVFYFQGRCTVCKYYA